MRITAISTIGIAAILIASPSFAGDPNAPKKDKSQQIVCKTDSYVGSHIPQRICKTRGEWDEAAKQSQGYLDENRRMGVDAGSIRGKQGG